MAKLVDYVETETQEIGNSYICIKVSCSFLRFGIWLKKSLTRCNSL